MATAAGYWLDQGQTPQPRPNEIPRIISWPHGYFDPSAPTTEYTNQDAYVYLLRVGGLKSFALYLQALATSSLTVGAPIESLLAAYGSALDVSPTGLSQDFGGAFSEAYSWYVADRVYVHSTTTRFRAALEPASDHVLNSTIIDPPLIVPQGACLPKGDGYECTVVLSSALPLAARVVTLSLPDLTLPAAAVGKSFKGIFSTLVPYMIDAMFAILVSLLRTLCSAFRTRTDLALRQ